MIPVHTTDSPLSVKLKPLATSEVGGPVPNAVLRGALSNNPAAIRPLLRAPIISALPGSPALSVPLPSSVASLSTAAERIRASERVVRPPSSPALLAASGTPQVVRVPSPPLAPVRPFSPIAGINSPSGVYQLLSVPGNTREIPNSASFPETAKSKTSSGRYSYRPQAVPPVHSSVSPVGAMSRTAVKAPSNDNRFLTHQSRVPESGSPNSFSSPRIPAKYRPYGYHDITNAKLQSNPRNAPSLAVARYLQSGKQTGSVADTARQVSQIRFNPENGYPINNDPSNFSGVYSARGYTQQGLQGARYTVQYRARRNTPGKLFRRMSMQLL